MKWYNRRWDTKQGLHSALQVSSRRTSSLYEASPPSWVGGTVLRNESAVWLRCKLSTPIVICKSFLCRARKESVGTVDAEDEKTSGSPHGSSQQSLNHTAGRTDAQAPEPTGIIGCSASASSQPGFSQIGRHGQGHPRECAPEPTRIM